MPASILFIDKTDETMAAVAAEGTMEVELRHCPSYANARKLFQGKHGIAVVVTELGLDNGDAFALLEELRQDAPSTIRIVLTSRDTFADAQAAINRGQAWLYLVKPSKPGTLAQHLSEALRAHINDVRERKAARRTLLGSVKALVDILDLVNPEAIGNSKRIHNRVLETGKALGVRPLWTLEMAVMLSHIGCVALPNDIVCKMSSGAPLSPEEKQIMGMHPSIAANLLANIEQMAPVARIIEFQAAPLTDEQPLESRIIKIALDVDRLETKGLDATRILESMRDKGTATYDKNVVEAMLRIVRQPEPVSIRKVGVGELREGMVMAEDMIAKGGSKLLLRGQPISKASLYRLQAFPKELGVREPLLVYDQPPQKS